MEKEKQVQNNVESTTTDSNAIQTFGDYMVLPTLFITREKYDVKGQQTKQLWSYGIEVDFYGQKKTVGLKTPNDADADWNKEKRDKYGYQILDAMFDALGTTPLAIKLNKNANGEVRNIEYYVVGFAENAGTKILVDHIQVVTQKTSSEALLRSTINRLSLTYGWGLPVL